MLVASPLDAAALVRLRSNHDLRFLPGPAPAELRASIADREVVAVRSGVTLSDDVLAAAPDLRLIIRAGSGLDNIDLDSARTRRIRVVRVNGMSAPPVAEMTFALLLSLARHVVTADRLLRQGRWPKADLGGPLLHGKTLGIVGAGNIGAEVGEMGSAWGMRVLGCVAAPHDAVRAALAARGITLTDFDTVVTQSHFVSLHVPHDRTTHHMVDGEVLDRMVPGSLLVNMARGGVVDEKALREALLHGRTVAGAALDVHEAEGEGTMSPLAGLDNVVLTPHIGAMAVDSQRLIGERVLELLGAFATERLEKEVRNGELVV